MSLLANIQAANIGFKHRLTHTSQDEPIAIVLLQRQANMDALIDYLSIETWVYNDHGINNERLPPSVLFELHIPEELITTTQVKKVAAIKHGKQIFEIVTIAPGEAGIFYPTGAQRFWRFWLAPLEELP